MTDDQSVTLGEIFRMCQGTNKQLEALTIEVRDRHHKLADEVNAKIGPLSVLQAQMTDVRANVGELEKDVQAVTARSWFIAGGAAVLGALSHLLPMPWGKS